MKNSRDIFPNTHINQSNKLQSQRFTSTSQVTTSTFTADYRLSLVSCGDKNFLQPDPQSVEFFQYSDIRVFHTIYDFSLGTRSFRCKGPFSISDV